MKKTFKGYSALIALLIALLVVTSMPMMAFAADEEPAEGEDHVVVFTVPIYEGGSQIHGGHSAYISNIRIDRKPTCDEPGKMIFTCIECSKRTGRNFYHDLVIPAYGHFYASDGFVSTEFIDQSLNPVEDLKAVYEKYNLEGKITVPVLWDPEMGDFDYEDSVMYEDHWGQVVKHPTCTEAGLAVDECVLCHAKVDNGVEREIKAKGHFFDYYRTLDLYGQTAHPEAYAWEVDAQGREMFGEKLKAVPSVSSSVFKVDVAPTCRTEGKGHFICLRPGCTEPHEVTISINEDAHKWDGWAIIKKATCAGPGERRRQCLLCGAKEWENYTITPEWKLRRTRMIDCYHAVDTKYCATCAANGTNVHADKDEDPYLRISHVFNTKNPYTIDWELCENVQITVNGKPLDQWIDENPYNPVTYDENMQQDVKIDLLVCELPGKVVYKCVHFEDGAEHEVLGITHDDDKTAKKTVTIPAREHKWGKWYRDFDAHQGGGTNENAAWFRTCEYCGYTQQKGFGPGVDPNNIEEPTQPQIVNPAEPEPVEVVVPNKYAVDATKVEGGTGTAVVSVTEGNEDVDTAELFARVTWVYELSDGSTFAYAAMAPLKNVEGELVVNVGGAMTPKGAKLVETQIALTDDANANLQGEFHYIAGAVA